MKPKKLIKVKLIKFHLDVNSSKGSLAIFSA